MYERYVDVPVRDLYVYFNYALTKAWNSELTPAGGRAISMPDGTHFRPAHASLVEHLVAAGLHELTKALAGETTIAEVLRATRDG
jgi:hypothetical protein